VCTGRVFDAAEALGGRLVSRVVPADELLPAALAIAREIADNTSAVSVFTSKRLLWSMLDAPSPWDAHRLETAGLAALGKGPDAAEGVMSFLEKRPAVFPAKVDDWTHLVPDWPAPPADLRGPGEA
jgi:enoyl-CoA hydratase/carnithine racemase